MCSPLRFLITNEKLIIEHEAFCSKIYLVRFFNFAIGSFLLVIILHVQLKVGENLQIKL